MGDVILGALTLYLGFPILMFCLWTMILRWVFQVHRAIRALESIDESLQQLPVVRRYHYSRGRKAA